MESQAEPSVSQRHKCSACCKQYKKKEHLIEHMKVSFHSIHDPKCMVCKKHCKSFESVREHLTGPLPKGKCAEIFAQNGCELCLNVFEDSNALNLHKESCVLSPVSSSPHKMEISSMEIDESAMVISSTNRKLVALDCEMVGAGSDGSLDVCARVCLVDENEDIIFHTYVEPLLPVTNYRYEITGITEDNLSNAMPLMEVSKKIEEILFNGESIWRARIEGGKACLLVGHDLDHDFYCLRLNYPEHLIRDTAKYRPLMRTNLVRHSLKYLTCKYLGYEIQTGIHDPFEDSVAALRLYKRMRDQMDHHKNLRVANGTDMNFGTGEMDPFGSFRQRELVMMSPDELLDISVPKFKCWCLDRNPN